MYLQVLMERRRTLRHLLDEYADEDADARERRKRELYDVEIDIAKAETELAVAIQNSEVEKWNREANARD